MAGDLDRPIGGAFQRPYDGQKGRLPRAGWSDDPSEFSLADREIDTTQGLNVAPIVLGDPVKIEDHRCRGCNRHRHGAHSAPTVTTVPSEMLPVIATYPPANRPGVTGTSVRLAPFTTSTA